MTTDAGSYSVSDDIAAPGERMAFVVRQVPDDAVGGPVPLDTAVRGTVVVSEISATRVSVRLDFALAGGANVTGSVDAVPCSATVGGDPRRALKMTKVDPSTLFVEGGEVVNLETENGCEARDMRLRFGDVSVAVVGFELPNRYLFTAPRSPRPAARTTLLVSVHCARPPDDSFQYDSDEAEALLVQDPELEPQPVLKTFSPQSGQGTATIPLDSSMQVTFSRAVDRTTVTATTFRIEGVAGHHTFTVGDDVTGYKAVEFTPDAPLQPDHDYTCVVTNGVKSKLKGKVLKPGVTPLATADHDAWTFHTVCDGCGAP